MTSAGFRPPTQARSRASLEKVLDAAEQILADQGPDALTMQGVADRSGTSIGAIYRRFAGKETLLQAIKDRLLTRMEDEVRAAVGAAAADGGLLGVVSAFVHGLAETFGANGTVVPHLMAGTDDRLGLRGAESVARLQGLFLDAAAPHLRQVTRPDPVTVMTFAARSVIGGCIHRTSMLRVLPDGISWALWAEQMTAMTGGYLTGSAPA